MAIDKAFLKEHGKYLLGGIVLGAILGAGAAGFAVYKSQEPGRQALVGLAKAAADLTTCTASIKEFQDGLAKNKELIEKTVADKAELERQLTDARGEVAKLTESLKKLPPKAPEKPQPTKAEQKKTPPTYSRRPVRPSVPPEEVRENWEEGL
ncbi:MAG: hypothetical protein KGZ83_15600 [Sulfuricella sp.]|nr:hypothetical protein [Sulfuricella sp.]